MKAIYSVFLGAFVISASGYATESVTCKQGKVTQTIAIVSKEADKKVPCEVTATREGEAQGKMLYNATNDASYCETQMKKHLENLAAKGWTCDGAAGETAQAPATQTGTTQQ